jgi:hypothetical protein
MGEKPAEIIAPQNSFDFGSVQYREMCHHSSLPAVFMRISAPQAGFDFFLQAVLELFQAAGQ